VTDAKQDDESTVAAWDFRVEQERETFQIYERRRLGVELQATAITAAALTIAALLVVTAEELSDLSVVAEWGIAPAIGGLLWAIGWASVARFASWRSPTYLGRPPEQPDEDVNRSLKALRTAKDAGVVELRRLGRDYWRSRAHSAWKLGDFKWRLLKRGLWGLSVPFVYLFVVGVSLLPPLR